MASCPSSHRSLRAIVALSLFGVPFLIISETQASLSDASAQGAAETAYDGGAPPPLRFMVETVAGLPGLAHATSLGMNETGDIVGYAAPEPYHPASSAVHVPAGGTLVELEGEPPALAYGVNRTGAAVGQAGRRATAWIDGARQDLRVPEGWFSGSAHDVTDGGLVVGSYGDHDLGGPQHCVWPSVTAPAVTLRGPAAGGTPGSAWAASESGRITGTAGGSGGTFYPVRWDTIEATPVVIPFLPGATNGEGRGINEMGDVVGRQGFPDGRIQAFLHLRAKGVVRGLGFLPGGGPYAEAFDVNAHRAVVGTASAPGTAVHAVLWYGGAIHDLNELLSSPDPQVEYLTSANAIDDQWRIAAEAVLADGTHAIVRLVPAD